MFAILEVRPGLMLRQDTPITRALVRLVLQVRCMEPAQLVAKKKKKPVNFVCFYQVGVPVQLTPN